jgi:hypothetical protein
VQCARQDQHAHSVNRPCDSRMHHHGPASSVNRGLTSISSAASVCITCTSSHPPPYGASCLLLASRYQLTRSHPHAAQASERVCRSIDVVCPCSLQALHAPCCTEDLSQCSPSVRNVARDCRGVARFDLCLHIVAAEAAHENAQSI